MGVVAVIFGLGLLVGVALIWAGRRRVATDGHPHCLRCGFDLFGRPGGSDRCPECGTDLTDRRAMSVRWKRRGWMAWVGTVVALCAMGGGGAAVRVDYAHFDVIAHLPTSMLLWNIRYGPLDWANRSRDRLDPPDHVSDFPNRLRGEVDERFCEAVLDRADKSQFSFCVSHVAGFLSTRDESADGLRERLLKPFLKIEFTVRPRIRLGDPIPIRLSRDFYDLDSLQPTCRLVRLRLQGREIPLSQNREQNWHNTGIEGSNSVLELMLPNDTTRDLPLETVECDAEVEVSCRSKAGHVQRLNARATTRFTLVAADGPLIGVRRGGTIPGASGAFLGLREVVPAKGFSIQFRMTNNREPYCFCKAELVWHGQRWPLRVWTGSVGTTEMSLSVPVPAEFKTSEAQVHITPDPYCPRAAYSLSWGEVPDFDLIANPEPFDAK